MKADKTGYTMLFHEKELELIQHVKETKQISDHDGILGFIDALQQKTKANPSMNVRLDM
jgi:hypothetical protein